MKLNNWILYRQIKELKEEFGNRVTRAEELKLVRSLDLKLQMEDRVARRNALQVQLLRKKAEAQERIATVESTLRDGEVTMTTPRSLRRRKIIRRVHIGRCFLSSTTSVHATDPRGWQR